MRHRISYWATRVWRSSLMFAAFATVLRVGAQLLLLPALLIYLSPENQAMWWVFVALGNFANLADFGFGQAITRVYSFLWAGADDFEAEGLRPMGGAKEPNIAGVIRLNHAVQHLYWRFSIAAMAILAVAGTLYLYHAVSETGHGASKVWGLWAFYLVAIGFNFGTSYWLLACQGINRVREVQVAYVLSSLTFLVVVLCLLKLGWGLTAMVIGTMVRGLLLWRVGRSTFYKVIPRSPVKTKPDFSMVRRIWPNARKFGVLSIAGYLQGNGGVLVSRYFLGVEITAAMGLTAQAGNFLVMFAGQWLSVKWPQITVLRIQERLNEMSLLFARRLALAVITFLICAGLLVIAGDSILEWKHSHTRLIPLPYLVVYFLYLLHQLVYVQFGMLVFTENIVPFCTISLLTGIMMMVLSLILTPLFGLWGLILSPLLAEVALSGWIVIRRGFVGQPLAPRDFFRAAISGRL